MRNRVHDALWLSANCLHTQPHILYALLPSIECRGVVAHLYLYARAGTAVWRPRAAGTAQLAPTLHLCD